MKNPPAPVQLNFVSGILDELKKVSWPSRRETIRLTIIVVVISLITGFYIGILDLMFAKVLELLTKVK